MPPKALTLSCAAVMLFTSIAGAQVNFDALFSSMGFNNQETERRDAPQVALAAPENQAGSLQPPAANEQPAPVIPSLPNWERPNESAIDAPSTPVSSLPIPAPLEDPQVGSGLNSGRMNSPPTRTRRIEIPSLSEIPSESSAQLIGLDDDDAAIAPKADPNTSGEGEISSPAMPVVGAPVSGFGSCDTNPYCQSGPCQGDHACKCFRCKLSHLFAKDAEDLEIRPVPCLPAPNLPPAASLEQFYKTPKCFNDLWGGYAQQKAEECRCEHTHLHRTCDCAKNAEEDRQFWLGIKHKLQCPNAAHGGCGQADCGCSDATGHGLHH